MNDREIMENLLLTTKGVCDLYMHGTIESGDQNIRHAFDSALSESLCMQDQTYQKMSAKGWYPAETVDQQKVDAVRQKFAAGQA